jgi:hypothetical protein
MTVKFVTPLKLSVKRVGNYFGRCLTDPRQDEKPLAAISIYLLWSEGEVWVGSFT